MAISGAAAAFAAIGGTLAGIEGVALVAYAALAATASYASQSMARRAQEKAERAASTPGATNTSFRNPAAPRQIIYGKTRVGGPLAYLASTPGGNGECIMTVMLASHECTAIDEVWLDDYQVTLTGPTSILRGYRSHIEWVDDAPTTVVDDPGVNISVYYDNGRYKVTRETDFYGFMCELGFLGSATQTASPLLVNLTGGAWTSDHRLRGICHLPILFSWMPDMFPSGVPNPSAVVRGKRIYDPRKDSTNGGSGSHRTNDATTWEYSNNSALCLLDYLLDTRLGLAATATEIDFASFRSAADVCDQSVETADGGTESRYTCNGALSTEAAHENNILSILSSMDGRLVYSGGRFRCFPGAYVAPTVTFTENDLAGAIQVQTQQERSKVYNAARGEFASPLTKWQRSDYPPYVSSAYYADDQNEYLWADLPLPMTTSASTATRLAKLAVRRSRKQIVVSGVFNLSGLRVMAGETVALTIERYGWNAKPFTVEDWKLNAESSDGAPQLTVSMTLREIDQATFAWTAAEEQTFIDSPPTDKPDPFNVSAPTGVTLSTQRLIQTDGTVLCKIRAIFAQSTDPYVTGGGKVVMQWKPVADETYGAQAQGLGNSYELFSDPVQDGIEYNVRLRFENVNNVTSPWWTGILLVAGDLTPPGAVTGLSAIPGLGAIRLEWVNPSDTDLAYIQIFENSVNNRDTATKIADVAGTSFSRTGLATGATRYYWARAKDTSGNVGAWNATSGVMATVSAVSMDDISGGAISIAKFAAGITPVEIVSTLPSSDNFEGRMVYLTTDDKLYRYTGAAWTTAVPAVDITGTLTNSQIADLAAAKLTGQITTTQITDSAISTAKLAAGSVSTAKLAAGAVTADTIAANAITAVKIAASAVEADKIAANAITSDKITANAITAGKIAAGAVSASQISVSELSAINASLGTITGGSLNIGSAGNSVQVNTTTRPNAVYVFQNSQAVYGLFVENFWSTANGGGAARIRSVFGYALECTILGNTTTQDYAAIAAAATYSGGGDVRLAVPAGKGGYAGYANSGTWSPFTGSHDGLIAKGTSVVPGDILVDGEVVVRKISDALTVVHVADDPAQFAIGVYVSQHPLSVEAPPAALRGSNDLETLSAQYDVAVINAVGEGSINVCGQAGDIAVGDLIVTSATPGKGMRQSDDILRAHTVARAREAVTFSAPSEVRQIACIYLCG